MAPFGDRILANITDYPALQSCSYGGAVFAEVTSNNTVGYITSTVPTSGNKTFAVTLTDCADPGAPVRVDNLITSSDFSGGSTFDVADQIWRWDTTANNWAKYFYQKSGRGDSATYAWKKWNYGESKVEDLSDADSVAPGQTFLFRRMGAATISLTLSGQVQEFTASPSYSIPTSGNVFMTYPWPIEIKLSNLNSLVVAATATGFSGGSTFDVADQIWRWDTAVNNWAKYFYQKSGRGDSATYAWKKWNYSESKIEDLSDADKLVPGEGFLFRRMGDATLIFTWNALKDE